MQKGKQKLKQALTLHSNSISTDETMMTRIQLAVTTPIDSDVKDEVKESQIDGGKTAVQTQTQTQQPRSETENINTTQILHPIIIQYVTNEMFKYDISNNKKQGLKKFLSILWDIGRIMGMTLSHVFDTASDIALAIEWYILYQKQLNDSNFLKEYNIDMEAMFWGCCCVILYYRISSSWEIYKFSHSFFDVFLQFFFDFYLIKLIYINVFKMKSHSPMKMLKIMRSIEGQNESGFQSILTMAFLIKTNFGEFNEGLSIVPILSFCFSFWSLTSRFIFGDFHDLQPHGQTIGININHIDVRDVNVWYIFHLLFRLIEVLFSILVFSLIWVLFGGIWLFVLFATWYLWLIVKWKLLGYGLLFYHNFLADLMVFDIQQILIGFNLHKFDPYSRLSRQNARLLFFFLGLWLLFVRVLLCCIVIMTYSIKDNDTTLWCVIISIIFILIWFGMAFFAIRFYINKDNKASGAQTATNKLNGIDMIKSNDSKSIIFCKELGIDVFTHKNYKQYNDGTNIANNVLEAMIISNDIDNYSIVEEWYYDIGMKQKTRCNFEHFLKHSCEWNGYTIRKLVQHCDSLDYYKLIYDKLEMDLSLVHPEYKINILHYAARYGRDFGIIEWILANEIISNINAVDKNGGTCLHWLMHYMYYRSGKRSKNDLINQRKIAQLFISRGVDVNIKTKTGQRAKGLLYEMKDQLYDWLVSDVE